MVPGLTSDLSDKPKFTASVVGEDIKPSAGGETKKPSSSAADSKQSNAETKAGEVKINDVSVDDFISHILNLVSAQNRKFVSTEDSNIEKGWRFASFQSDQDNVAHII